MTTRKKMTLYIDDSGNPQPDHIPSGTREQPWFALGGILIEDEKKDQTEAQLISFVDRWPQIGGAPLHAHEIRRGNKNFAWLQGDSTIRSNFYTDLQNTMLSLPVIGVACVVDRNGYNNLYKEKYGKNRWLLCRTAFGIVVERALKHAHATDFYLRVYVEKTSKERDQIIGNYYNELKKAGLWFDKNTSVSYNPLDHSIVSNLLYEFQIKPKASLLMQVADLFLHPMCVGGYDFPHKPYQALLNGGRLINSIIPNASIPELGIKYSCFTLTGPQNTKTGTS